MSCLAAIAKLESDRLLKGPSRSIVKYLKASKTSQSHHRIKCPSHLTTRYLVMDTGLEYISPVQRDSKSYVERYEILATTKLKLG